MNKQEVLDLYIDESDDLVELSQGDWIQDHKYQYRETIVQVRATGEHYMITDNRSGSYHTDWCYDESYINKVRPVEKQVTITEWINTEKEEQNDL